ncbi:hypothetical protein R3P38DRAFT_3122681 [Favolaschia claudopus]|uniref:Uncharacterized protein n=1 Tax=Favolaschia claudopus TaxID=2862362 RepID=A0AAV9ZBU1_9AGAR
MDADIQPQTPNACVDGNPSEPQSSITLSSCSAMLLGDIEDEASQGPGFQHHGAGEEFSLNSLSSSMAQQISTSSRLSLEAETSLNPSQWSLVSPSTLNEIPIGQNLSSFSLDRLTIELIHESEDVQLHQMGEGSDQHSLHSWVETTSTSFYRVGNGTCSSFYFAEPEDQEDDVPLGSGLSSGLPITVDHLSIGSISGGVGGGGGQGGRDGGNGGIGAGPQLTISDGVNTLNINLNGGTLYLHTETVRTVYSG